jgi:hypothetical protein
MTTCSIISKNDKMKTNNLEILNNYFKCQYFELNTDINIYKQFESYYKEQTLNHQYGLGIKELATNQILVLGLANDIENDLLFEHQLSQMNSLSLQNVLMLFALVLSKQAPTFNPFYEPENYPSQFASELLQETNGYVLFRNQLMQLLSSCLPSEKNNTKQIVEYTRQYNSRNASFFKKLETLNLPDGYCLSDLLKKYTLIENNNCSFGFVSHPMYILAYQFIQQSKKYLTA